MLSSFKYSIKKSVKVSCTRAVSAKRSAVLKQSKQSPQALFTEALNFNPSLLQCKNVRVWPDLMAYRFDMCSLFSSQHFTRDLLAFADALLLFSSFYSFVAFQLFPHSSLEIANKRETLIDMPLTLPPFSRQWTETRSEQWYTRQSAQECLNCPPECLYLAKRAQLVRIFVRFQTVTELLYSFQSFHDNYIKLLEITHC